jgi:hypothetical protein
MMGEVLSLKLHRKRKTRSAKESEAAANRAKFGRAKDERKLTEAKRDREEKRLDGHKIEE